MNQTLTFEIELQSDYHISAGSGKGSEVDSALLRDSDGMPVIRGTSISGLLRDGLWKLLQLEPLRRYRGCQASGLGTGHAYCGQFGNGTVECPLCRIFGTPNLPKRWNIGSARPVGVEMPVSLTKPITTDTQVIHRVRVNPRTRRAEPHKLFSQENGDSRLKFRFEVTRIVNSESLLDDAALLVAAARNVRELGRSRKRGQGECRIHLIAPASLPDCVPNDKESLEDKLLDRFKDRWLNGTVQCAPLVLRDTPPEYEPSGLIGCSSTMHSKRFWLIVRLDEPIILTRRSEAGNQFETLDAISGTSVWGAFAALATKNSGLANKTSYTNFVTLFRREQVHFSWLYPLWRCTFAFIRNRSVLNRDYFLTISLSKQDNTLPGK
jgi:CRISPR-associated protein Csx10